MPDYQYLIGADDALRAAHIMDAATDKFTRAVDELGHVVSRHNDQMDRLIHALSRLSAPGPTHE